MNDMIDPTILDYMGRISRQCDERASILEASGNQPEADKWIEMSAHILKWFETVRESYGKS